MTAPLQHDLKAVNAEVFLSAWLLPLIATTPASEAIGSKRWAAGMVLPYRTVRRITGMRTIDADLPMMRVDTLAASYTDAAREADRTDSRVMVLVNNPEWGIPMPDGSTAFCEWAEISAAAHEEPYAAQSVVTRFVSEYRFGLSFVTA
jgi:hypothetical protein